MALMYILLEKYMPTQIKDATWKVFTSAFSEQLEAWKADTCKVCPLASATRKDDMVKANQPSIQLLGVKYIIYCEKHVFLKKV